MGYSVNVRRHIMGAKLEAIQLCIFAVLKQRFSSASKSTRGSVTDVVMASYLCYNMLLIVELLQHAYLAQ